MGRKLGSLQECKDNFCNAVKYIWALRSSGASPKVTNTLTQYRVSRSYSPIVNSITGQETDVNALCEELYEKTRELNRAKNARAKAKADMVQAETPSDLFNPETLVAEAEKQLEANMQEAKPQEASLDRLRYEIRQEILAEMEDREQREFRYKREKIASECLYRLVSARPKDTPESLAGKAVAIADNLLKILGGLGK